jgi:hypothetical protein
MYTITDTHQKLKGLATCIERLHDSSAKMLKLMEGQVDAIIASDAFKIEKLSEEHDELSVRYKIHEDEFIATLSEVVGEVNPGSAVRLSELKKLFPECAETIDTWQTLLYQNTQQLQKKNEQILELLEFALSRNAKLMRSLYSLHHEKNTRYAANGDTQGIMPGVAVNQEA